MRVRISQKEVIEVARIKIETFTFGMREKTVMFAIVPIRGREFLLSYYCPAQKAYPDACKRLAELTKTGYADLSDIKEL